MLLRSPDRGSVEVKRTLTLGSGQALDATFTMALADRQDSVQVEGHLELLEAAKTQVSHSITPAALDGLPLNGRNYLDLALLAPGVARANTGAPQQFAETSAVAGSSLSVSGQRNLSNTFIVDGVSANDDAAGLAGTSFSQEVVREFQVINAGGNAEFGRASSGIVNIMTRSGSNNWHGRGYGFLRNQRLDARHPLALSKDPLTQAQYGASAGGPIRSDRDFLFANFEQTRRNAAGFVTIAPANVMQINSALDGFNYPGPRTSTGEYPTGWDTSNGFIRTDHHLTNTQQLTLRYSVYDIQSDNARGVGGLNDTSRATRLDDRDHSDRGYSHRYTLSARSDRDAIPVPAQPIVGAG